MLLDYLKYYYNYRIGMLYGDFQFRSLLLIENGPLTFSPK